MLVIGITGKRGSGKSLAAKAARSLRLPVLEMSAPVIALMRRRGIGVNNRSVRLFATRLRKEQGMDAAAKLTLRAIKTMRQKPRLVVVNGIRSVDEAVLFSKTFSFKLIAISSPLRTRFERISRRGRKDDPRKYSDFLWSEEVERRWGLEKALRAADYRLMNKGSKLEFTKRAKRLLARLSS